MSELEDAYRRLLGLYPAEHRREHEQEMLGLLMELAAPGQRRPRPQDAADLLYGALRIHLRRALAGLGGHWRDALVAAGVVATVMQTVHALFSTLSGLLAGWAAQQPDALAGWADKPATVACALLSTAFAAVAAHGALRGRRSLAAVFAWLYAICEIAGIGLSPHWDYGVIGHVCSIVLTAVALTVPPGAPRGTELIDRKRLLHSAILLAFVLSLGTLRYPYGQFLLQVLATAIVVKILATATGGAAHTPAARRAVVLLTLPAADCLTFSSAANPVAFMSDWPITLTLLPAIVFYAAVLRRPDRSWSPET